MEALLGFHVHVAFWDYATFASLYGGVVVLPVIAIYTIGVYWVFRGKFAKS
jgi:cytochrome bd-type quinol oxidase subunit 2